MIIFPMCPLTKIFVPEYQQELMKNPSSLLEDVPQKAFRFSLSTSRRDYIFRSDQPAYLTDANLCNWLLGGDDGMQCQETDWTGLIKLDIDAVQNGSILAAIAGVREVGDDIKTAIDIAKDNARQLSRARVMRQIRAVNTAMLKQYEKNREDNKGLYTPSATEFLCAFVLAEEQQRNTVEKKELCDKFAQLMQQTFASN
jgi:hypothetical protein